MALELEFLVKDGATVKIQQLKKELGLLDPKIKKVDNSMGVMNNSLAKLAVGYISLQGAMNLTKSFIAQADSMTLINSKLKLVTKSTEELADVQSEIVKISQETRTALDGNVTLYQRMSMSTKELNLSQTELLDLTRTISKSMIVSGTDVAGVNALVTQLGQAFSSNFQAVAQEIGTLRDQSPRLYQAILKGTETTGAEFKKMAENGELTNKIIIDAIKKGTKEIAEDYSKMGQTIGQSMQNISTSTLLMVGNMDKVLGVSDGVVGALNDVNSAIFDLKKEDIENYADLAKNIGLVGGSLLGAKIALAGYSKISASVIASNGLMSVSYTALTTSLGRAMVATKALSLAMKTIPFVAIASGIYLIVDAWIDAKDAAEEYKKISEEKSKGYSGKGVMADLQYETAVKNLTTAFDKMEFAEKAHLATRGTQNEAWYKGLFDTAKKEYEAIEKETVAISDRTFATIKKSKEESGSGSNGSSGSKELTSKELKAIQKQLELNERLNDTYIAITGSEYDAWANDVSNKMIAMAESTTVTTEELKKYHEALLKTKEIEDAARDFDTETEAKEALQSYNEEVQKTYEAYVAITGTEYDVWLQDVNNQMIALAANGSLTAEQLAEVYETLEESRNTEITIDGVEDSMSSMQDMLDMQIELAESGMSWSDSLSGTSKDMADISKAMSKIDIGKMKFEKSDLKLQEDYAKDFLAVGDDMTKQKELEADFDADQAQLNKTRKSAEIAGYANLAGAMSTAFSEGSTAAKAFQGIQATLGIVNGFTAITAAWASAPFPFNVPAVVATTAQMIPLIGQLTSLGGSGGGGGGGAIAATPTTPRGEDYYSDLTDITEQTNKPILDKFDRQIELLEEISGYGGTSLGFSLDKALAEYTAQTQLDIINASEMGAASGSQLVHASVVGATAQSGASNLVDLFSEEFRDNIFSWFATARPEASGVASNTHATALYGATIDATNTSVNEFIDILKYMESNNLLDTFGYTQIEYENILSDFQNATNEFVTSLLSDIGTLIDFSDDLKGAFDELTGTTKYEDIALSDAFADVNSLIGDSSLADYMEEQIKNIDALEDSLSDADIALLLSSSVDDFKAQQDLIAQIQSDALITLDVGVVDALNYKDSILLVSDALAEANEDMIDFKENIASLIEDIDNTIASIRGNTQTQDEFTDDEIRRLNLTQRALETSLANNDTDEAQELIKEITSLSTSISNSAFGDTSLLDQNLISNLEATKALISFEDEVINVNIVSSEIVSPVVSDTYSPSVTISNPANDSERLDNLEAIMTQVLITNRNVYDILLRIEDGGLKTI